jgi:hypothetical protein
LFAPIINILRGRVISPNLRVVKRTGIITSLFGSIIPSHFSTSYEAKTLDSSFYGRTLYLAFRLEVLQISTLFTSVCLRKISPKSNLSWGLSST